MCNASLIILLVFVVQAHAKELAASSFHDTVFQRALKVRSLHRTDLENTTLEKGPGGLIRPRNARTQPAALPRGSLLNLPLRSSASLQPRIIPNFAQTLHSTRSTSMSVPLLPHISSHRWKTLVAARMQIDEEPIDVVPLQGGGKIQKATKDQLMPIYDTQVLDTVGKLVTACIFEPEVAEGLVKTKDIQTYVYKKLLDRFGPYNQFAPEEKALFLAYDDKDDLVGSISIAVVDVTDTGLGTGLGGENIRPLLEFLSVVPAARGKKIGRALVERVEAQVKDWGYDEVLLQVAAINDVAIKLYKKMGYEVLYEDNTISRPGKGDLFGGLIGKPVSWIPAQHLCMRKGLSGKGGLFR